VTEHRYERKYLIENLAPNKVINILNLHPAIFKEIYPQRMVNNIYLDTIDFNHYYDNINGLNNRTKIRIRWYGEDFGYVQDPTLEIKSKDGHIGSKLRFHIKPFLIDDLIGRSEIYTALNNVNLPPLISHKLRYVKAVLMNQYYRKYFISLDRRFRITIDYNMKYYGTNNLFSFGMDNRNVIMELKYSYNDMVDQKAREISNIFPFRMTKNSKYINGIKAIYGF